MTAVSLLKIHIATLLTHKWARPVLFACSLAVVGLAYLALSNAATPANYVVEAESGTQTCTTTVSDAAASGGSAVKFGSGGGCTDPLGALARIPWEGGSTYWGQFAKANAAGWTDPSFFPISVFLGKSDTAFAASLKDAGINLYMGVEHNGSIEPLTNTTNQGIFVMPSLDPENPSNSWTQAEVGSNPKAVAWFITDECDQGYSGCPGDQNQALAFNTNLANQVRAYNDGRFLHSNYGNGILRTFWSVDTMPQQIQLMDSASADKYSYTSPDVGEIIDGVHDAPDWPNGVPVARAYSYGWQADQMRRFQDPAHIRPVWTFVEAAMPYLNEAGAKTIQTAQIEGAVWSAIIHEARGVAYFQHNNGTTTCTGNYAIVECSNVHTKVKAIDAEVQSLAPVLNTQSYANASRTVNGFTYQYYTFNNGTDTMLKSYQGSAYVIAGLGMHCSNTTCTSGVADTTGSKTFTLPVGVTGTTVEVVGESRTLPVTSGTFTDTFANEYTHHVYKIAL